MSSQVNTGPCEATVQASAPAAFYNSYDDFLLNSKAKGKVDEAKVELECYPPQTSPSLPSSGITGDVMTGVGGIITAIGNVVEIAEKVSGLLPKHSYTWSAKCDCAGKTQDTPDEETQNNEQQREETADEASN